LAWLEPDGRIARLTLLRLFSAETVRFRLQVSEEFVRLNRPIRSFIHRNTSLNHTGLSESPTAASDSAE